MQSADAKPRSLLAANDATNTAAAIDTTAAVAATSATDSLAAALKGESTAAQEADLAQYKKDHPLLAILQVNPNVGPIAAYALAKDTAEVNRYLAMPEIQAEFPLLPIPRHNPSTCMPSGPPSVMAVLHWKAMLL